MEETGLNIQELEYIIEHAFREDIGEGDITTNNLVPENSAAKASMTAKADGVIAGLPIAKKVFKKLDPNLIWKPLVKDGDTIKKGDVIVEMHGSFRALLTGERLALNLMQRMSGIASETAKYVAEVKHTNVQILDTRKTVPGLRSLDKYSVKTGGGTNHRIGLYDLVMIKDNHIKIAGGIAPAVEQVRKSIPNHIKVEVETTNIEEVKEALSAGADIIMLDNMSNEVMTEAVHLVDGKAKTEASGNMSLERLKGVAETGVDFISIGALTHSVTALDISQNIIL
ncbi:carboxylating nicotinate-nucleotide diphosphorylase [Marinifilum flexuosum]|uniref:Probable nicotinate-nucleotide pyrophosphorylase [carboxylating] n=1 Tax=Marinifilum flexuosum TaxID=1117708 RepID=A0A419X9I1_9BACT|nr:carboxylating nicotinate-nucleotide diphosphorylase [Marinifilum flexuosum]RKE04220.1 nicotinate-nucleotide pyrophosphorylase [carboxylating] [Marinifilum flexuosum]